VTSQTYGDGQIWECQMPKPQKAIDTKFDVDDDVGDITQHAKI